MSFLARQKTDEREQRIARVGDGHGTRFRPWLTSALFNRLAKNPRCYRQWILARIVCIRLFHGIE